MGRPIHLLDLVTREKLERILHVFTEVAGVASIITYPDGHPITAPHHFTPFCHNYCRATTRGRARCSESDRYGGLESARLRAPFTYQCLNGGLTDCAAPVIIDGHHLATVLCGQVLEKPPMNHDEAVRRAKEIGIEDVDGYLWELAKVPVMSREKLLNIVNLMSEITVTISELALQKYISQKNSQRYLSRLVNSVSDCIISANADNEVSMVNQAGAAMFGYEPNQIIGRHIDMLFADRSPSIWLRNVRSNSGGNWRADLSAVKVDGTLFPVQVSFSEIHDERESRVGCVGVIRDISEEKKIEQMKEDLIGMITHDLRNPVLSLERALQILSGGMLGPLNVDQKPVMDLALVTCHQLFGMVSDILDIYRNENGKLVLRYTKVAIQGVVEQTLEQMESLTREKGINMKIEVPSAPFEVTMDESRIRRTCVNLLDNAIKYSPEGGNIMIRVQIQRGDECDRGMPLDLPGEDSSFTGAGRRDGIIVSVEDEGVGIPETYHQCIFDKYFTLKTDWENSRDGVGLGLAFCKLAIEAHGGRIWVESPVNDGAGGAQRGCRFCFTLPSNGSGQDC